GRGARRLFTLAPVWGSRSAHVPSGVGLVGTADGAGGTAAVVRGAVPELAVRGADRWLPRPAGTVVPGAGPAGVRAWTGAGHALRGHAAARRTGLARSAGTGSAVSNSG